MDEQTRHNFPDQYEQTFGVKILPTKVTSVEAYYQHWLKQHQFRYIETNHWKDAESVDSDEILIEAALGGDPDNDTQYFCIKKIRYYNNRTEFGYVVQDDDLMMEPK